LRNCRGTDFRFHWCTKSPECGEKKNAPFRHDDLQFSGASGRRFRTCLPTRGVYLRKDDDSTGAGEKTKVTRCESVLQTFARLESAGRLLRDVASAGGEFTR